MASGQNNSLLLFHPILFFLVHLDGELCMIVSVVAIQLAIDQYLLRLAEFVCEYWSQTGVLNFSLLLLCAKRILILFF